MSLIAFDVLNSILNNLTLIPVASPQYRYAPSSDFFLLTDCISLVCRSVIFRHIPQDSISPGDLLSYFRIDECPPELYPPACPEPSRQTDNVSLRGIAFSLLEHRTLKSIPPSVTLHVIAYAAIPRYAKHPS